MYFKLRKMSLDFESESSSSHKSYNIGYSLCSEIERRDQLEEEEYHERGR